MMISEFLLMLVRKILFKTGLYTKPSFYYAYRQFEEWKILYQRLKEKEPVMLTSECSKSIYQEYDLRELNDYAEAKGICLFQDKIVTMSYFDMRQEYLKYLYQEVDRIITRQESGTKIKILEIGCGNCINLINLQEKYGERLNLFGIDISDQRINSAKEYFGGEISSIKLHTANITEGYKFPDNSFHLVFSMHCLEQISYECKPAIREMYRLTSDVIVMIEPVFELGNLTQRLYLTHADQNRILLTTIRELNLSIRTLEVIDIQSNPANQSSLIVIDKDKEIKHGDS